MAQPSIVLKRCPECEPASVVVREELWPPVSWLTSVRLVRALETSLPPVANDYLRRCLEYTIVRRIVRQHQLSPWPGVIGPACPLPSGAQRGSLALLVMHIQAAKLSRSSDLLPANKVLAGRR